ncbi:hypothetical protein L2E82_04423 [Cichorium intybus]|uniref:Uncharacterized protein n=2 Tax=Cichorium intybus TaxID=13427 RepID=A0ACB8YZJ5_CICIN|nr:hypothetical protein L2E82_48785 [Cichorium intybus]KAI3790957.1 hypothetical protein L2E82_04423 [Cichorium intybus]
MVRMYFRLWNDVRIMSRVIKRRKCGMIKEICGRHALRRNMLQKCFCVQSHSKFSSTPLVKSSSKHSRDMC